MNPIPVARRLRACSIVPFIAVAGVSALADTPPAVTSDPEFRAVASGTNMVLTPTVTGDALTSCQWFKDGAAIAGATNVIYSVPSVAAANAGYYTAVFTNGAGFAKAAVAVVAVDGAPPAPDTSATAYRTMDYAYRGIVGAENIYLVQGSGAGSSTYYLRQRVANLAASATIYTGRQMPSTYQSTTWAIDCGAGSYNGTTFTPARSWTEYTDFSAAGAVRWGDTGSTIDGGLRFPANFRLGQTVEETRDYYEGGVFKGTVFSHLQLQGVEAVDVTAGRFHGCLHFQQYVVQGNYSYQSDQWWAAGLGLVKEVKIESTGITSTSQLVATSLPASARFTIADYFTSRVVGTQLDFTGTNWSGFPAKIGTRIVSLAQNITSYTGFPMPTPTVKQVMALERASTRTDVPGSVTDTWFEYYTAPSNILLWGMDDDPGTRELRFENGIAMPVDMAVGETVSISRNAYLYNGSVVLPLGPAPFSLQLLGVEKVDEPAGSFANTLHLRFTLTYAGSSEVHDEWLSPGLGGVRYRMVSGPGLLSGDLASFAVPSVPTLSTGASNFYPCALGGTAQLSVLALGNGPLTFQWYRGESGDSSTPIAGATSYAYTTPALSAWTRYWVRVTNAVGSVDSATMLVMPAGGTNTLADWTLLDGIPANQRGAFNTPAGDNFINRVKFALGVSPMGNPIARLPRAVVVAGTGADTNKYLALEFTRNVGAQGIRLVFEMSSDLITWNEAVSVLEVLPGTPGAGLQNVRLRQTLPVGTDTRRFARLKVASP